MKSVLQQVTELQKRRYDCEYGKHEKCLCYKETDAELKGIALRLKDELEFLRDKIGAIEGLNMLAIEEAQECGDDLIRLFKERIADCESALKLVGDKA